MSSLSQYDTPAHWKTGGFADKSRFLKTPEGGACASFGVVNIWYCIQNLQNVTL
jgi:hypothetical protein